MITVLGMFIRCIFFFFFTLILLTVSQVISQSLTQCTFNCDVPKAMSIALWASILIRKYRFTLLTIKAWLILTFPRSHYGYLIVLNAAIVIWTVTLNPRKDFALAELPSPTDSENYYRPAWSSANVADGIEDDSLEPEGQVMLV
jgi:hypothetical protein